MADKNETIKLLRECDAGTRMGISSLEDVMKDLPGGEVFHLLEKSKKAHEQIRARIAEYLKEYQEDGKEPAMMATAMAKMKESMKMMMENPSCAAANVIIDGCNMGIKSIYKYLNQYPNAEDKVKNLVYEIVKEEEELCKELRHFL